jgi:hypothetical protein
MTSFAAADLSTRCDVTGSPLLADSLSPVIPATAMTSSAGDRLQQHQSTTT